MKKSNPKRPRKCTLLSTVIGRKSLRSSGGVALLLSSASAASIAGFVLVLASVASGFEAFAFGRDGTVAHPVWIHSEMDVIVKLTAISMALGRYVPMLTKRFDCMSR